MALTTRKDILDTLVYSLGTIIIFGSRVTAVRQRDTDAEPFDTSELPAFNVKDQKAVILHNISDDEHTLPVTIEIHTTSQVTTSEADELLAAVVDCINTNSRWGNYADGTNIDSHEIDISQSGDVITAVMVEIQIYYTTDKGKI